MPIAQRTKTLQRILKDTGQIDLLEVTEFYDTTTKEILGLGQVKTWRTIDLETDVSVEDQVIQDVSAGLRTTSRLAARGAKKSNRPQVDVVTPDP